MAVNIRKFNQPQLYNYKYDQLNRITRMDVWRGLDSTSNSWPMATVSNDYTERIAYDGNGNILKYFRNAKGALPYMDSLTYHYKANTNQLDHVRDAIPSTWSAVDIDKSKPE